MTRGFQFNCALIHAFTFGIKNTSWLRVFVTVTTNVLSNIPLPEAQKKNV